MLADNIFYVYLYRKSNTNSRVTAFFVAIFTIPYVILLRICLKCPQKVFLGLCDSDSKYSDRDHMHRMWLVPKP